MRATRKTLLGCPVDSLSQAEILHAATHAIAHGKRLTIEGLNVAKLIAARRDATLMAALKEADIVHIDGAGVAVGAQLLGHRFPARRAGIDLMDDLLQLCAAQKAGVFLLGAKPDIVARAAVAMQVNHPNLVISGYRDGYFADQEAPTIAQQIAASGAALLLIGISSPKKEIFLHRHMEACGVRVAMGVGGAFDVAAGAIPRAPLWMQKTGLEWVFRLVQEPRRLAWRYAKTNSKFAVLLIKERIKKHMPFATTRPETSWNIFFPLLQQIYGEAAAVARHEIFFLHRPQGRLPSRLRAIAALLRDAGLLYYAPRPIASNATTYAVVTLAGASGYGTIKRAMDALAASCELITHPRMRIDGKMQHRPARPPLRAVRSALVQAGNALAVKRNGISRIIVASCVVRHALWQASWRAFYRQHPAMKRCLLHNDFDMMSSACVSALSPELEMICIQHGIPTDEFFPTRAPTQVVWGETSRAVYAQHHSDRLIVDALGRGQLQATADVAPQALQIISQTHTPLYGLHLQAHFEALATALMPHATRLNLQILLHPQEVGKRTIYRSFNSQQIARPPHSSLHFATPICLLIGYASTALIDAALTGHYVAAMDWPATASAGARAVCTPPARCANAADVLALWRSLRESDTARAAHHEAQRQWLAATFTASGALQHLIESP